MGKICGLLFALAIVISSVPVTADAPLDCSLPECNPYLDPQTITIPMNAIASTIVTLGASGAALVASGPAGLLVTLGGAAASLATSWGVPDIVIELETAAYGDLSVVCGKNACPAGTLHVSATYRLHGNGSLNTIPVTEGQFAHTVPVVVNLPDNGVAEAGCGPSEGLPEDSADQLDFRIDTSWAIKKVAVDLQCATSAGVVEILSTEDAKIDVRGGDCEVSLSCEPIENTPPYIAHCPENVSVAIGGTATFAVTAGDVDLARNEIGEELSFATQGFGDNDPGVEVRAVKHANGTSASILITVDASRIDLLGSVRQIGVDVVDASGASRGKTVYIDFTAAQPPVAYGRHLGTYTVSEYRTFYGRSVTVPMEATYTEPGNGFKLRFLSGMPTRRGGGPDSLEWNAGNQYAEALVTSNPESTSIEQLNAILQGTVKTGCQCTSGTCTAEITWRKTLPNGTLPPGKYVLPFVAYEYNSETGELGFASYAECTLKINPDPVSREYAPQLGIGTIEHCACTRISLNRTEDGTCMCVDVAVLDKDFDFAWSYETVTLSARFAGGGGEYWLYGFGDAEWRDEVQIEAGDPTIGTLVVQPSPTLPESTLVIQACDVSNQCDEIWLRFSPNDPPQVSVDGRNWASMCGYATQATCHMRGPAMLTMDPAWYDVGCLQFRDLDGDALIFRVSPQAKKGRADLLIAGGGGRYSVTILYTIDREEALKDHRGEEPYVDRFSVVATDPSGEKAVSNVEVTLEVLNSDPECAPDEAETFAGVPILIDVVANDTDPDEDTLTITAVGSPAHGMAEIVGNEIRYTPDSGYCGEDAFTYEVADGYGGSATGTVTVIVLDTIPPIAVCQDATVFLDANGTATLDPAVLNNGSTDNCGIAGFAADPGIFSCEDVGDQPVTLTVSDTGGNKAACDATVTVVDAIHPAAVGQDVTVMLDEHGQAAVNPAVVGAASTDNCSIKTYSLSQTVFTCADLGANTEALTVTDPSGNTDDCTMTVTVIDTTPPVAACQNLTVSLDADGVAELDPAAVGAPSTDNCAIAGYALDRDTFTCADIGEHTVTLTVTDTSGLTDTCQATITVVDDLAPSIACPGSIFTAVAGSETSKVVSWTEPAITDNCGLLSTTATHTPGDRFPIGSTTVQYTATDIHGNVGSCTFRVNVAEPLSLSCSDVSVSTPDPNGATVTFSPNVEGGCDPRVTCTPPSGSHFPVGTTQVNCTATGDCGGSDSCTFTVTVEFVNQAPWAFDDEVDMPQGGGCMTIPVLANDFDPDGHAVFISWVGSPSCGTTAIVSAGGAIEYCTEGCSDPPDRVTFKYRVSDGYAESAEATVSVNMPSGPIILFCPPPPDEEERK